VFTLFGLAALLGVVTLIGLLISGCMWLKEEIGFRLDRRRYRAELRNSQRT